MKYLLQEEKQCSIYKLKKDMISFIEGEEGNLYLSKKFKNENERRNNKANQMKILQLEGICYDSSEWADDITFEIYGIKYNIGIYIIDGRMVNNIIKAHMQNVQYSIEKIISDIVDVIMVPYNDFENTYEYEKYEIIWFNGSHWDYIVDKNRNPVLNLNHNVHRSELKIIVRELLKHYIKEGKFLACEPLKYDVANCKEMNNKVGYLIMSHFLMCNNEENSESSNSQIINEKELSMMKAIDMNNWKEIIQVKKENDRSIEEFKYSLKSK